MPELPEVETTVRGLNRVLTKKKIVDVWTSYESPFHRGKNNIKDPKYFSLFKKEITGSTVTSVTRKAKNILINLSIDSTILIHMKMTGHLLYGLYEYDKKLNQWSAQENGPLKDPFNQFIRLVLTLSDGRHIAFSDMRKFGKVTLIKTSELEKHKDLVPLGPEPLDPLFDEKLFTMRLNKRPHGRIKQVLMDQHIISGIGNIYSDEILWEACIHPLRQVSTIKPSEIHALFRATQAILTKSITLGGDSMSDYRNLEGEKGGFHPHHNAYHQHGKNCTKPQCRGTIQKMKIGGRSAHFCNTHQKKPRA